jgi:hypothetical protein
MKKSLFEPATAQELVDRNNKILPSATPLWGKMNAPQMFAHCSVAFEGPLGKVPQPDQSNILFRTIVKWVALSLKPFRKGLPTAKEFTITDRREFEKEKTRLISNIHYAQKFGHSGNWQKHIVFGKLTPAEWGWLLYKHTDHHLQQFGV